MNAPPDFGLKGTNIGLKRCSISGMTRSTSSTRFELTMEISISFDNRPRRPIDRGSWFRFAKQDGSSRFLVAGGSQIQSSTVEIDCVYEVLFIAESSSGIFHPLNLGIDRFAGSVRDG